MKRFKDLFDNLDKTDLKIMRIGIKFCFGILIIAIILLILYLSFIHTIFLYELGLAIFRLSTYIAVEFIICGFVADRVKKQID